MRRRSGQIGWRESPQQRANADMRLDLYGCRPDSGMRSGTEEREETPSRPVSTESESPKSSPAKKNSLGAEAPKLLF